MAVTPQAGTANWNLVIVSRGDVGDVGGGGCGAAPSAGDLVESQFSDCS